MSALYLLVSFVDKSENCVSVIEHTVDWLGQVVLGVLEYVIFSMAVLTATRVKKSGGGPEVWSIWREDTEFFGCRRCF